MNCPGVLCFAAADDDDGRYFAESVSDVSDDRLEYRHSKKKSSRARSLYELKEAAVAAAAAKSLVKIPALAKQMVPASKNNQSPACYCC